MQLENAIPMDIRTYTQKYCIFDDVLYSLHAQCESISMQYFSTLIEFKSPSF